MIYVIGYSENFWKDPTLTLLLLVMSHTALRPETLAIVSNLLRENSEVFDKGLVDNSNVTPSLRGLFPLSDLWYSSHAPSHRQSTFITHELRLVLSQSKPRLKLCRWLGGNVQRIKHSLFYTVAPFIAKASPLRFWELPSYAVNLWGGCLSIFSHSLLILYQSGQEMSS